MRRRSGATQPSTKEKKSFELNGRRERNSEDRELGLKAGMESGIERGDKKLGQKAGIESKDRKLG